MTRNDNFYWLCNHIGGIFTSRIDTSRHAGNSGHVSPNEIGLVIGSIKQDFCVAPRLNLIIELAVERMLNVEITL